MAGEWIKMRTGLRTHPKVVRMSSALKADRLRVIGGLFAVWSVFDEHSTDGRLEGYTPRAMDEEIGWRGFANAMESIGWLESDEDGLTAPEFDEHNSASAKRRALDASRKKSAREADSSANGSWNSGGHLSASEADEMGTREEQEKNKPPVVPRKRGTVGEGRFPDFWTAWPQSERKQDRKKCLAKWQRDQLDAKADAIVADVEVQKHSRKWLDGFEPAPLTYLNGERWADGAKPVNGSHEGFL